MFFQEHLQISWESSGADIELLEQVILTRNDFTHNIDLLSLEAFQTPFHAQKYPSSAFANPKWKGLSVLRAPLIVPADTLQCAVRALRTLCEYLDRERFALLQRWRKERKWHKNPRR